MRVSVQIRATTELPLAKVSRIGSYVNSASFSRDRKQKISLQRLKPNSRGVWFTGSIWLMMMIVMMLMITI